MTPRERARARLSRHVPDFGHWQGRQPARRVAAREDREGRPERSLPGGSVRVRDGSGAVTRAQTVDPGPNAPLLMRIVRDPYRLDPGRSTRVRWRDEPESEADAGPIRVAEILRDLRPAIRRTNPFSDLDHAPRFRPHPFARVRGRSEAETHVTAAASSSEEDGGGRP